MPSADPTETVVCVDFGSTFTKAALVDLARGGSSPRPRTGRRSTPTSSTGTTPAWPPCVEQDPRAAEAEVLACSSAGGGLRIAVVGNEALVTAEAGRRVALSSGGRSSGSSRAVTTWRTLDDLAPDVVLLTGGTDGGNAEALLGRPPRSSTRGWRGPVVVAGNVEARDEVARDPGRRRSARTSLADNVVPRIGVLAPGRRRAAIREMFLAHVIGGKHLSSRADFTAMVAVRRRTWC